MGRPHPIQIGQEIVQRGLGQQEGHWEDKKGKYRQDFKNQF